MYSQTMQQRDADSTRRHLGLLLEPVEGGQKFLHGNWAEKVLAINMKGSACQDPSDAKLMSRVLCQGAPTFGAFRPVR